MHSSHLAQVNKPNLHPLRVLTAATKSSCAGEEWLSFYSGDTALGFSLYAAALALLVARGWDGQARKLSRFGGPVALVGAFLRIVGFMHWFTDVLVGVIFGVLIGFGLPTLLFSEEPVMQAFRVFNCCCRADAAGELAIGLAGEPDTTSRKPEAHEDSANV